MKNKKINLSTTLSRIFVVLKICLYNNRSCWKRRKEEEKIASYCQLWLRQYNEAYVKVIWRKLLMPEWLASKSTMKAKDGCRIRKGSEIGGTAWHGLFLALLYACHTAGAVATLPARISSWGCVLQLVDIPQNWQHRRDVGSVQTSGFLPFLSDLEYATAFFTPYMPTSFSSLYKKINSISIITTFIAKICFTYSFRFNVFWWTNFAFLLFCLFSF